MAEGILLSGGMDSIALTYWKRPSVAITLDYGQRAADAEIEASRFLARELEILHYVIAIDLSALGSGDMAGASPSPHAPASDWWPYRNQMLVTVAAMKALSLGLSNLMLGTVASDIVHRDGSREFFYRLNELMSFQEGNLQVSAPAIDMSTDELILASEVPPRLLALAHSCHKSIVPCGQCRGCNKYFAILERMSRVSIGSI